VTNDNVNKKITLHKKKGGKNSLYNNSQMSQISLKAPRLNLIYSDYSFNPKKKEKYGKYREIWLCKCASTVDCPSTDPPTGPPATAINTHHCELSALNSCWH
jgi:hypothetical protein